jgi:hypothetical protein
VRVWAEGNDLHSTGEVVGTADGLLELYVLLNRSTVAYEPTDACPAGRPFHLVAPGTFGGRDAAAEQPPFVQVDLVNGASVWYTFQSEPT